MTKELKTRISMKHDTEENWDKAINFIPLAGEIIIYDIDDEHSEPRIKIGDGSRKVGDLSFTVNEEDIYKLINTTESDITQTLNAMRDSLNENISNLEDRLPSLKVSSLTDISGTPEDGQSIVYNAEAAAMAPETPYNWDYSVTDWTNVSKNLIPLVKNKPLKFALSKAMIRKGQKTSNMSMNGINLYPFDYFDLDSNFFYDVCCVVRNNGKIWEVLRPTNRQNGIFSFQFIDNINNYELLTAFGPKYNFSNNFTISDPAEGGDGVNTIQGNEITYNGFALATNGSFISDIQFDIDLYILYPALIGSYNKELERPVIENSIFYDIDFIKVMAQGMNSTPADGWFKMSDKPLLYKHKDSLMCLGRTRYSVLSGQLIQYYEQATDYGNTLGDFGFFIPSNIIPLMNNALIHENVNGYDQIKVSLDGENVYPYVKNDETGLYIYWPVATSNDFADFFNSGLITTYEIDNSIYKNISVPEDISDLTDSQHLLDTGIEIVRLG